MTKIWLPATLCSVALGSVFVAPNANTGTAGNTPNSFPTTVVSQEIQELVGAGQFPSGGPIVITAISFRSVPNNGPVSITIGSVSLSLSTSSNFPNTNFAGETLMSTAFTDNVGPDATVVFSGSNVVLSDAGCPSFGVCPFDVKIVFTTPFFYRPSAGPLLIDLSATNLVSTGGAIDAIAFSGPPGGPLAQVAGPLGSTTGAFSYQGNIVQFTYFNPLIISQIADGGGWQTTLVLTNTTATATSASLNFFQDTGGGNTQSWNPQFLEVNSTASLMVPGGGTIFLHTPGTASTTTSGWAEMQSSGAVGYAIFTQRVPGRQNQDGTAAAAASANNILVPFDNTAGFVTSMAIVNPNPVSESVSVSIQPSAAANPPPGPPIMLPAQGHMAFTVPQQFSTTAGQSGLLEFTSINPFLIHALRFNSTGAFIKAPV
jgi:hypothetical protein